ncbi:hypothetical protein B0J11DRAFT_554388 [Dendryphion nanum]|uniref:DUF7924 domain-containing protein n=1 Tax=Dendryphion nanum TaxID=256645 RepID=A0A9P9I7W4_9PLEO|nr:hypothetical protein B0J11DRAFT_554388 [Dendryphion nanum]
MMAAPPTPRNKFSNDRGRRGAKRHARSHGSRTPSPSKRPSPQTYRTRNMHHAGVFVDKLVDLPGVVDDEVRRILRIKTWGDQVNARECLLEGDWKASMNSVVRGIADLWLGVLKTHMSEKVWNSDLKPTGVSLKESLPEDSNGAHTPRSAPAQSALPDLNPDGAASTAAAFTGTEAADPYHISTPKPDITIGIAHTAFVQRHQRRLVDRQASGSILSDPHAADMGIRFPFLVVEAKGLGLNGSLISAQNQAAISGTCILVVLKDLSQQAAWNTSLEPEVRLHTLNAGPTGPVHELWVHFEHEGAVYTEYLQSWRTVRERDAQALVKGEFRDAVVNKLEKIPRSGAFG